MPWLEWGPDGTRLLRLTRQPMHIMPFGSRVAIILASSSSELGRDVYIVDVRPHSRAESFGGAAQGVPISGLAAPDAPIDASETIAGLKTFAEVVTTRLPCRIAHIQAKFSEDPTVIGSIECSLTHEGIVFKLSRK